MYVYASVLKDELHYSLCVTRQLVIDDCDCVVQATHKSCISSKTDNVIEVLN